MRKQIQRKQLTWIDIKSPQASDIEFLRERFHFDPIDLEEISRPTYRPKAEDHGDYIFIVLHFPVFNPKKKTTSSSELEFFLTENFLISIHPLAIPPLESAFEGCGNHLSVASKYLGESTAHLLYYLIIRMFDSCFPKLDCIAEKIDKIEEQIFEGNEKKMVEKISVVQREILDFRRTLKPQRMILESLAEMDTNIMPKRLQSYFRDAVGSNIRIWNALENHKETIEALKETNESLLSNKISEIMKILTIISFVTLPLSVISNYFSMSVFGNIPLMNTAAVPFVILAAMIAVEIAMIIYFKRKKWL